MFRTLLGLILLVLVVAAALYAFGVIDVRQTREAKLPEVKAEGGQLPAFDVDAPDVDVGTRNETVKVPEISVGREKDDAPRSSER